MVRLGLAPFQLGSANMSYFPNKSVSFVQSLFPALLPKRTMGRDPLLPGALIAIPQAWDSDRSLASRCLRYNVQERNKELRHPARPPVKGERKGEVGSLV